MSIGQRIRVSRRAAGLSLRDLEAKIDNRVTAQAISKYERDESMPSSGVLIVLANALGVSVDYLVSDSEISLEAVDFRRKTADEQTGRGPGRGQGARFTGALSHGRGDSRPAQHRLGHATRRTVARAPRRGRDGTGSARSPQPLGGWASIRSRIWSSCWRNVASRSFRCLLPTLTGLPLGYVVKTEASRR